MSIYQHKKTTHKTITFRLDEDLIAEFRTLCKEFDIKQVSIIESAMKKAILEIKEFKEKENERSNNK